MWEPSDSISRVGSRGTGLVEDLNMLWQYLGLGRQLSTQISYRLSCMYTTVPCCSVGSTLQSWNRVSFRAHQQHHAALNYSAVRFQVKLMQPRTERGHLPQLSLGCQRWLRHLASRAHDVISSEPCWCPAQWSGTMNRTLSPLSTHLSDKSTAHAPAWRQSSNMPPLKTLQHDSRVT